MGYQVYESRTYYIRIQEMPVQVLTQSIMSIVSSINTIRISSRYDLEHEVVQQFSALSTSLTEVNELTLR